MSHDRDAECGEGELGDDEDPYRVMALVFMSVSVILFVSLFLITFLNRRSKLVSKLWTGNDLFINKDQKEGSF